MEINKYRENKKLFLFEIKKNTWTNFICAAFFDKEPAHKFKYLDDIYLFVYENWRKITVCVSRSCQKYFFVFRLSVHFGTHCTWFVARTYLILNTFDISRNFIESDSQELDVDSDRFNFFYKTNDFAGKTIQNHHLSITIAH